MIYSISGFKGLRCGLGAALGKKEGKELLPKKESTDGSAVGSAPAPKLRLGIVDTNGRAKN